ncbi:MAG TPA: TonB-dependent receptor [Candidatus Baltobacteraceae bacterium]|nr:TonB-dependent receptor [Candidatus Baltobacteraceae bacterium]
MNRFFRALPVVALVLGLVGPLSMGTSYAQTSTPAAAPTTTGTVQGTIKDNTGAPVADAKVTLSGVQTKTTTSDAGGAFSFTNLASGVYTLTASKAGYQAASEPDLAVFSGQTQTLAVVMPHLTFSSLRTIASVRAVGRGTFNTTPASISVVSSQTFIDQSQPQVMKILNETPGIVASLPSGSANGATPGAITVPNIRGALSFETASLIDGHPVSVGTYGDYVTTFLNPFMLQNIEVVKGPGADAPEVNYAIGGTVNFRTKDPTYQSSGLWQAGVDNWGSSIINFGISDTTGRLGYVFAFGSNDLLTNVANTNVWVSPQTPQQGILNFNGSGGMGIGYNDQYPTPIVPGTVSAVENSYNLVACCQHIGQDLYQNRSELAKLRYHLSAATTATFTYFGSQTHANQTANTGDITPSFFQMSASQSKNYTGSLANGSGLDIGYVRTPENETNNEPILEGDLSSSIGNDTVLARYYAAGIHRLNHQGSDNPFVPTVETMQLYGYDTATKTTYNGLSVPVTFYDYYNQAENDALKGYSFEYHHPFGDGNALSFSYDTTHSTTTSYSVFATGGPSAGKPFKTSTLGIGQSVTLPTGSAQDFGTALLRGTFRLNPKLGLTWSNYFNTYKSTYPLRCNGKCSFDGTNYVFATTTRTHYDPRLALEYRPSQALAVRLAVGSAIAPPYLALLSGLDQPISYDSKTNIATQKVSGGTLNPETAIGFDLGGSYRLNADTFVSLDVYTENLQNHFLTAWFAGGTCPATDPVSGAPTNCKANTPLYLQKNVNLADARFQGLELDVQHSPQAGFGYKISGALLRGYPYNLPQYFYCSIPGPGCKPDVNLGIVSGKNFYGNGIGAGANGLSNTSVPYSQGFAEVNYRTHNGWYANANLTYYGPNNSMFVPAFTTLGATLRAPLVNGLSFQISGDNLTDKYANIWPSYGTGIPVQLANGTFAATQANTLYPRTIRFTLTKTFGQGAPTP